MSDMKILHHLRQNSRANLTTISRKTGIPVSTIFDKIRGYEQDVVHKFTVLLDFTKLGYTVRAKILLKVDPQMREQLKAHLLLHESVNNIFRAREQLKAHLLLHESVNNIFRVNNGYDYAIDCVFTSIREVEEFIETLELQFKVIDKTVYHIIEDIAREKALTTLL